MESQSDRSGFGPEIEVVLRELERARRAVEERRDCVCGLRRLLAAVCQRADLDAFVHRR